MVCVFSTGAYVGEIKGETDQETVGQLGQEGGRE